MIEPFPGQLETAKKIGEIVGRAKGETPLTIHDGDQYLGEISQEELAAIAMFLAGTSAINLALLKSRLGNNQGGS